MAHLVFIPCSILPELSLISLPRATGALQWLARFPLAHPGLAFFLVGTVNVTSLDLVCRSYGWFVDVLDDTQSYIVLPSHLGCLALDSSSHFPNLDLASILTLI